MANDLVPVKKKSFWDTKEGSTGMVFGLAILGGLGYLAYKIMPYLANLMENTFYLCLFGLATVGLLYVTVFDNTLRSRLWLMYKLTMRALTYSIIKYDPIGILREIQKKAKERIKLVDESRATVKGQVRTIQQTVEGFKNDEEKLKREITFMQKNGKPPADIQNSFTKLGKLNEAEIRLTKSYTQTQGFYEQLTRAYNALVTIDGNIDFEIDIQEREYKAVNASNAAWRAVKAAFSGNDELDALRNDTMTFLADDYGNKLGEIESFMEDSKKFIDGVDLSNSMYADDGMKMLENLNARDLNIVQSVGSTPAITNNPSQSFIIPAINTGVKTVDYSVLKKGGQ